MEQLKPVIDLLKKIDEVVVPQNEFEDALRQCIPVTRVKNLLTGVVVTTGYIGGPGGGDVGDIPYTKGGLNTAAAAPLEITFTSGEEKSAADKAAQTARRNAQLEQNALPVWHTQSTVSGEITKLGLKEAAARKEREGFLGETAEDSAGAKKAEPDRVEVNAIHEYYAAMAAQKAREAAEEEAAEEEEEDEEEEEEEEEEDEFEDVVTADVTPSMGTPAAVNGGVGIIGGLKEEESDSSSSSGMGMQEIVLSQVGNGPPTKKVKVVSPQVIASRDEDDSQEDIKNNL